MQSVQLLVVQVVAQLLGEDKLPWESMSSVDRRKLGAFRGPILQLLDRDPAKRPSMSEFYNQCNSVFTSSTTYEDVTKNYLDNEWASLHDANGQTAIAKNGELLQSTSPGETDDRNPTHTASSITDTMLRNDMTSSSAP